MTSKAGALLRPFSFEAAFSFPGLGVIAIAPVSASIVNVSGAKQSNLKTGAKLGLLRSARNDDD